MTIAERKAREAYDRENPWKPLALAKPSPMICELRATVASGLSDFGSARFFLHDDGYWYRIEPPMKMSRWGDRLTEFRPTGTTLSERRRASVVWRSQFPRANSTDDRNRTSSTGGQTIDQAQQTQQ